MNSASYLLSDDAATIACGQALAPLLRSGMVIYLQGGLGAGKTTFTRALLRARGYEGHVKSPTYTLVEPYEVGGQQFYHFDLYRLVDAEELELIGGRDYFSSDAICLVEWPGQGRGALPAADIIVQLEVLAAGRRIQVQAAAERSAALVAEWQTWANGQFSSEHE